MPLNLPMSAMLAEKVSPSSHLEGTTYKDGAPENCKLTNPLSQRLQTRAHAPIQPPFVLVNSLFGTQPQPFMTYCLWLVFLPQANSCNRNSAARKTRNVCLCGHLQEEKFAKLSSKAMVPHTDCTLESHGERWKKY